MKKIVLKLFIVLILNSCATIIRTDVRDENYIRDFQQKNIYIISNHKSIKHLNIFFPPPYFIDNYEDFPRLFNLIDKKEDIDKKIINELQKQNYFPIIINDISEIIEQESIVIIAKDVWQWDFRYYMHILKVYIYNKNGTDLKLAAIIGSEGNSSGIHNFPMPDKEIPRIIERVLNPE